MNLHGKRIAVTRAKEQASVLVSQVKKYGGIPVELPLIACEAINDKEELHNTIEVIDRFTWLVFTSKNGIDFFFQEYQQLHGRNRPPCKIAVVGTKTNEALQKYGLEADLIPEQFVAESLLESLQKVLKETDKVLIPRGNLARNLLPDRLRERGIYTKELDVYETVIEQTSKDKLYGALKQQKLDIITFTSSSTVGNFVALLEGTDWRSFISEIVFVSIGPITSQTMVKEQLPVHVEAKEYTIAGMLKGIAEKLEEEI